MITETRRAKFTAKVMGTNASLHIDDVCDGVVANEAWNAVHLLMCEHEKKFSTFLRDSEISRINRGEVHLLDASPEVLEVFDACTWLEHVSNGAFSAYRPDGLLDPAGFVKGWVAEKASRCLAHFGLSNWYLSVGGDIQTSGRQANGDLWRAGVVDPYDVSRVRCYVDIPENWALATSGTAARGNHIWNVHNESQFVASFTVVGPHLMWADAFATAGFAMGVDGIEWVEKFPDYSAFTL